MIERILFGILVLFIILAIKATGMPKRLPPPDYWEDGEPW